MNYELAKQLKDAGFPQRSIENCNDPYECCIHVGDEDIATCPTLSELIEACGKGFSELHRFSDFWKAWGYKNGLLEIIEGQTPEEAVAKLWLELNEK